MSIYVVGDQKKKSFSTNYLELRQSDKEVGLWACFYRNM